MAGIFSAQPICQLKLQQVVSLCGSLDPAGPLSTPLMDFNLKHTHDNDNADLHIAFKDGLISAHIAFSSELIVSFSLCLPHSTSQSNYA